MSIGGRRCLAAAPTPGGAAIVDPTPTRSAGRGRRLRRRSLVALAVSAATACSGGPSAQPPEVGTGADVGAAAEVGTTAQVSTASEVSEVDTASELEAAITQFDDPGRPLSASLSVIHRHARERPDALRDAASRHLGTADADRRYAAVYALALTADDETSAARLREILDAADATERLVAANALVARGDKTGIPALIALLDVDEDVRFGVPPQRTWRAARFLLVQYTGQDLGLIGPDFDAARSAAAKPAWEQWWAEHGAALQWDADAGRFR